MGPASNFWMAANFSGSFLRAFSITSISGLKRMRREPMTSRTVVSQPYLPSRPSTRGWIRPGSTGEDGELRIEDGSDGVAGWAKARLVTRVKKVKRGKKVKTGCLATWLGGCMV